MHVTSRVTIAEIHRMAQDCIASGSTIVSDGHTSYKHLQEQGYKHVSQDDNKSDPEEFLKWLHILDWQWQREKVRQMPRSWVKLLVFLSLFSPLFAITLIQLPNFQLPSANFGTPLYALVFHHRT